MAPKSWKIGPRNFLSAKWRPEWLQEAPRTSGYSTFGAFVVENGAPRADRGTDVASKMVPEIE